jgi:acetyl-CoA carboxylase, biotin carboxylase subunit
MTTIKRVLVANRGEIALRIIRACHEEGLEAVAVYSEADRLSPHVRAANLAIPIGPAPAAQSYLDIAKLVDVARRTACQAVHPGYGFLSERAPFAEAVAGAGLVFVGPPASAIRAMGDKTEARRRMQAAGVPIVPGTTRPVADHVQARPEAARLGYPVLLKAVAGGGGKGMRLVREEAELESAFEAAASEAKKAFGAEDVYLEKLLERPRHIEIQILADQFGRVVGLGERECSIQRRHQKLIEEAPSLAVTPALRRRMSEAAVAAAGAVGYLGAGTIEFLLAPSGEFYFLEMNTRLQVEHPVTELVYGVDLVREQLRVAMGHPLRVHAGTLQPRGHAIECRITAEDPFNGFLPATGILRYLRVPGGPGVRWDGGIEAGNEITLYYDPLIAKLIVWGETRQVALERMRRSLRELVIVGIPSSQAFHLRVMDDPEFQRGDLDITYLERAGDRLLADGVRPDLIRPLAVVAALLAEERRATASTPGTAAGDGARPPTSGWLAAARREAVGGSP